MSRLDLVLIVTALLVTMIAVATLLPVHLTTPTTPKTLSLSKELTINISPTIVRDIKVIRDGKIIYQETKVGDPIDINWYKLVANWMFALYYWDKQSVTTIDGGNHPGFNNEMYRDWYYSHPSLKFYVSNTTDDIGFDTYTITPRFSGSMDPPTDISNTTHYIIMISGTYENTDDEQKSITTVFVTLKYNYNIGYSAKWTEVIFLLDKINPPITLNTDDAISVTWYIVFPKQEPYTDTFWRIIKIFMGIDAAPDFGTDHDYDDSIKEKIYFEVIDSNTGKTSNKLLFDRVVTWVDSDGYYVKLLGHYTPASSIDIDQVKIYLLSDKYAGDSTSSYYYNILSYTLPQSIHLDTGNTVIIKLTIKFANFFEESSS